MGYDNWDDYLDLFYEDTKEVEEKVDSDFCSCYNRDVVESHVCVNRIPTKEDKFLFCRNCRNCRKEVKK